MKKILISFILPVLLITFVFSSSSRADVPESKDPIKIVIMGYSGDNIINLAVAGHAATGKTMLSESILFNAKKILIKFWPFLF